MTLRLILTRHAKSDWDNPLDSDHARPLSARGQRAAPLIGKWLAEKGYVPDQALVSDAVRTRQTWGLIAPHFPQAPQAGFDAGLYLAGPEVLLARLRLATAPTVMLIAHNPGIAEFAARLLPVPVAHPGFHGFPTCATLVAEFDATAWAKVEFGTARCLGFVVPRELD